MREEFLTTVKSIIGKKLENLTFEEALIFFGYINKIECYLHKLKRDNETEFFKLKQKALELPDDDIDMLIFQCTFVHDDKLVRYMLNIIDVSDIHSDFEFGKEKLTSVKLPFWREFLKNGGSIESDAYLLYLNYFTLYTGRTGNNEVNMPMLQDSKLLERFVLNKKLSMALTYIYENEDFTYTSNIVINYDKELAELRDKNLELRNKIFALGGDTYAK